MELMSEAFGGGSVCSTSNVIKCPNSMYDAVLRTGDSMPSTLAAHFRMFPK